MIKIVGCFTAIFIVLSLLWHFERFPFDSSTVYVDNHYLAQTAQLADNMLPMEYEMVNDDQGDDIHKQLKETALFTNALLKKVALTFGLNQYILSKLRCFSHEYSNKTNYLSLQVIRRFD